jgi:hypothetical protein
LIQLKAAFYPNTREHMKMKIQQLFPVLALKIDNKKQRTLYYNVLRSILENRRELGIRNLVQDVKDNMNVIANKLALLFSNSFLSNHSIDINRTLTEILSYVDPQSQDERSEIQPVTDTDDSDETMDNSEPQTDDGSENAYQSQNTTYSSSRSASLDVQNEDGSQTTLLNLMQHVRTATYVNTALLLCIASVSMSSYLLKIGI